MANQAIPVSTGLMSAALLHPSMVKWFGDAYSDVVPLYTQWMNVQSATTAWEDVYGISGSGLGRQVAEGEKFPYDGMKTEYKNRFIHQQYGLGMIITKSMIEDDQVAIVGPKSTAFLKKSMMDMREIVCTDLLNNAFNSSVLYGDGVVLCSASHPTKGGTRSNVSAADFNEISLEQAERDIMDFRDMAGLRITVDCKTAIIPTATKASAHRLLKSNLRPATANNDANYLNDSGFIPEVMVNRYISDNDSWFLLTDVENGPMFWERVPLSIATHNDDETYNLHYMARTRFSVGVGDYMSVYGSPGA